MMKKAGFTLAEVLITLTIIGVIATLTLPALMSNVSEQQNITAFKKIINSLSEAGQMNGTVSGFDYSSITANSAGPTDTFENATSAATAVQSLAALLNDRLQVDQSQSGAGAIPASANSECLATDLDIIMRDNTAVCFPAATQTDANRIMTVWVDVNGVKGPNLPSTCTEEGCTTKATRVIRDQFPVTLVGGNAVPGHWIDAIGNTANNANDFAARYAMTK